MDFSDYLQQNSQVTKRIDGPLDAGAFGARDQEILNAISATKWRLHSVDKSEWDITIYRIEQKLMYRNDASGNLDTIMKR